jgi:hypothetical protein
MAYLGDVRLGDTFDTKFCTVTTTGAPTTLAGTPVISAYPGNSVTQLTAGITLTVDFDTVTGLNHVRVVATSGNGYATATNYQLVITTGTVGGTSVVGYVVAEFSIEARSAVMPTTAARTLDVTATGAAGIDWGNLENATTANALTATSIITTQKVDVETIKTNPVVNGGTVTFPTTATLASTTNITAATGITLTATTGLGSQNGPVATVTTLTNLPAITANWLTAAGTATDFGAEVATAVWTDTTAGDFTTALSVGKSVMNGVTLGTGLTVARAVNVTTVDALAANTITAASIATDAIDADALAADAVTEIWAKSCTEPTAPIAASPTALAALSWLTTLSRNKITQTATAQILKADDTTTTIATSVVSDDGTTATRGEFG